MTTTEIKKLWQASDYALRICQRLPSIIDFLEQFGQQPSAIKSLLQQQLENITDETDLKQQLRLFRHHQLVRIIYRDINQLATLQETLADLTTLADESIKQSLKLLYQWQIKKQGEPQNKQKKAQSLLVLAMGKQGAGELNLSSDIDLIFVFPEKGQTNARRPIENEVFFTRLCRSLINVIGSQTADGFVFRVDTRLRPFGESGPLAVSLDFFETYYSHQAREWERYAMIKARVITGNNADKLILNQLIHSFVYRRYLDFTVIKHLREMKALISAEMFKKGMDNNIKLGRGGIREIEFIGQLFQLMRGGQSVALQIKPILMVLTVLEKQQLLPKSAVQELTDAYCFLRLSENRIQAWQDQQTHLLPEDEAGRARLALMMGFEDWISYFAVLEQHRQKVQFHFDALIREAKTSKATVEPWYQIKEIENQQALINFKNKVQKYLPERGQDGINKLMPLLLKIIIQQPDPDLVLTRMLEFIQVISKRTSYLFLLIEYPQALKLTIQLIQQSEWIFQQLKQHPILLDELLDTRRCFRPLNKIALADELEQLLAIIDIDDLENQMEKCRQFANANKFRVAVADTVNQISIEKVSDHLTEIAEVLLEKVLQICTLQLIKKQGKPASEIELLIIAYGKLGGAELSYQSDLDLVFIRKTQTIEQFYIRLVQRFVHFFSTRTFSGTLYEIDLRLRPNGQSGMLVSTLDGFKKYQQQNAWVWEHQALIRARAVVGTTDLKQAYQQIRQQILTKAVKQTDLHVEIQTMRLKMRQSLDRSGTDFFDLKQGKGGIVDIEFMVQYGVLKELRKSPEQLQYYDNIRLLTQLTTTSFLQQTEADLLTHAYKTYRALLHHLALNQQQPLIAQTELIKERQAVSQLWQQLIERG